MEVYYTITTILGGVLVQLITPLILLTWMWRKSSFTSMMDWAISLFGSLGAFLILFLASRWDILGFNFRYFMIIACFIAILSFFKHKNTIPFFVKKDFKDWVRFIGLSLLPTLVVLWANVVILIDIFSLKNSIDLNYPLKNGTYYVVQGGGNFIMNYHGDLVEQQRFALDIVKLNNTGRRARGIYPRDLEAYSIYSDTIYSPIEGTVVKAIKNINDQNPPKTNLIEPSGNLLVLQHDSLFVFLAHLKENSVQVNEGDIVKVGQPLAQVGNSGNTSEPHLHIHSLIYNFEPPFKYERLIESGIPLELTFEERYLIRNSLFP